MERGPGILPSEMPEAVTLQKPLPDDALRIVAKGEKEDGLTSHSSASPHQPPFSSGRRVQGKDAKTLPRLPHRRMMRLRPDARQRSDCWTLRQRPDLLIDELKPAILT
jgi:hypothetical protein